MEERVGDESDDRSIFNRVENDLPELLHARTVLVNSALLCFSCYPGFLINIGIATYRRAL